MSMRGDLNVSSKPTQPAATAGVKKPIDVSNLAEVVVNVHLSNVPFSILALKTQWQGRLDLSAEVFTHSSVKESDFTPAAKEFVQKVTANSRVGPSEFSYEIDNHFGSLSDATLDICYQLSKKHSVKERQFYVQQLSQRLGKNQFFNGSSSLNIAVSSILKKLFGGNLKEMPANLSSWLQKVSKIAGY